MLPRCQGDKQSRFQRLLRHTKPLCQCSPLRKGIWAPESVESYEPARQEGKGSLIQGKGVIKHSSMLLDPFIGSCPVEGGESIKGPPRQARFLTTAGRTHERTLYNWASPLCVMTQGFAELSPA